MEDYSQYSGSSNLAKEKRPPPKRGHVKLQIARTLSGLVVPNNAAGESKQANRNSFRREASYN
ncbi:hypothetical protein ACP70R_039797 [Stipagrostis hirtigluma subsp. patula]